MTPPAVTDRLILLSFDVEEFDIPLEYGHRIPEVEQFQVTARGLRVVLELLDRLGVAATFFTTAHFAVSHPEMIRGVAERHEVASHGYSHSDFEERDLIRSRLALEDITGLPVRGFRRPRLQSTDYALIRDAGYTYNSSENPIFLPGRYNNLLRRRTLSLFDGFMNIPISVTPWVRFPLFWLSFKNIPLALIKAASSWTLRNDKYLSLFYHTWEFVDLKPYRLPFLVRRIEGVVMARRLEAYLMWLKSRGRFMTFSDFANEHAFMMDSQLPCQRRRRGRAGADDAKAH